MYFEISHYTRLDSEETLAEIKVNEEAGWECRPSRTQMNAPNASSNGVKPADVQQNQVTGTAFERAFYVQSVQYVLSTFSR